MIRRIFVGVSILANILVITACSVGGRVTVEEFRALAAIPAAGAVRYGNYCGIEDGRVYIAVHQRSVVSQEWTKTVSWISEDELTPELRTALEARQVHDECR